MECVRTLDVNRVDNGDHLARRNSPTHLLTIYSTQPCMQATQDCRNRSVCLLMCVCNCWAHTVKNKVSLAPTSIIGAA